MLSILNMESNFIGWIALVVNVLIYINNIFIIFIYLTYYKILLLVCTNATYLDKDYGFSVTVTYNDLIIINETISGKLSNNF